MKFPLVLRKNGATVKVYCMARISNCAKNRTADDALRLYYTVCWKGANGRQRETVTKEADARRRAKEILNDLCAGRADRVKLTPEKLAYYRACEQKLDVPLMTAVDFYLQEHKAKPALPLTEAKKLFLQAKKAAGVSKRHLETLQYHLSELVYYFPSWVLNEEYDGQTPSEYLETISNLQTRRNHRITLVTFGKWLVAAGLIDKSPFENTDAPIVPPKDPGILAPEELRAVLDKADSCIKLFAVLGAFGGLRAAEITRLHWTNIDWVNNLIVLPSDITKTKRRRTVILHSNLKAWLCGYYDSINSIGKIITCDAPHIGLRKAAKAAGVKWKHNCLRHSSISYMMALTRNAAIVAEQHGNSEQQVQENYKANTTEAQAKDWFNILP